MRCRVYWRVLFGRQRGAVVASGRNVLNFVQDAAKLFVKERTCRPELRCSINWCKSPAKHTEARGAIVADACIQLCSLIYHTAVSCCTHEACVLSRVCGEFLASISC
ncbi:hypothetical protein TRVL_09454 [Trypanosoma vivax]|nr:hypothetical protein TRVL_09454 [Trypanosoma vivax]